MGDYHGYIIIFLCICNQDYGTAIAILLTVQGLNLIYYTTEGSKTNFISSPTTAAVCASVDKLHIVTVQLMSGRMYDWSNYR